MKDNVQVVAVVVLCIAWLWQPIESDMVQIKPTAALLVSVKRSNDNNASASDTSNSTSPCDRYLRSAEAEVRNPRNHKFVTSNGWTERHRPRPEISVYSRIEEVPSPPQPAPTVAAYYQQQRDSFYHNSAVQQLPPAVRTSKRIIYYATLPDVVRPPAGYSSSPSYSSDPFTLGPGPFSADFRQLDFNRNTPPDSLQRNRLASYENVYNHGGGNGGVTSVTSKSTAVYNSRYDEPAEFRDAYYRPNEFTSKFASWAEPFYKSWTSSSWDKDSPAYKNNRGPSPSFSSWDRELMGRGASPWENRGSSWDNNRGSSWDNRGSSWDKELVEVPLQKPNGDSGSRNGENFNNNDKYPEVAVIHSDVIDVRGDRGRQQNSSPPPSSSQAMPPSRFTIIDVDPKPYHHQNQQPQQQIPASMRYEPPQKPMQYETYTPMQAHTRYEPRQPQPPSPMRYEQQYRPPPSSSSTRYGSQNENKLPSNGFNIFNYK
uniref:Uncharacterized protein n=1 Tax=Sipha flava TaxID=143950 RepID=A0A2S2Q051_9HEMI